MNTRSLRLPCRACAALIVAATCGCNPTWTKDGKPNDGSMPLPPDAKAPQQAGQTPSRP